MPTPFRIPHSAFRILPLFLPVFLLAACSSPHRPAPSSNARAMNGIIVSLRFTTATMLVNRTKKTSDPLPAVPDFVYVKYDPHTRFFLDNRPATLDQLDRYMPVHIDGHMQDDQFFADTAHFSSKLPKNILPGQPPTAPPPPPLTHTP